MKRLLAVALFIGACGSRTPPAAPQGSAKGSGAASGPCEAMRGRVEQLYRAEAQAKEPSRVDEAVADNTHMVMNDCAKDPAKIVPCLAKAATVSELEKDCLIPLDDEGTEGK